MLLSKSSGDGGRFGRNISLREMVPRAMFLEEKGRFGGGDESDEQKGL